MFFPHLRVSDATLLLLHSLEDQAQHHYVLSHVYLSISVISVIPGINGRRSIQGGYTPCPRVVYVAMSYLHVDGVVSGSHRVLKEAVAATQHVK